MNRRANRLYGFRETSTVGFWTLRAQWGWLDAPQYRRWEWPCCLMALDCGAGAHLLCVGAWKCELSRVLTLIMNRVIAIDIHPSWPSYAKSFHSTNAECLVMDARKLEFEDATFDRALTVSVLEHVADDGDVLASKEIGRVLKPGGLLVATVEFSREGFIEWDEQIGGRAYGPEDLTERIVKPSGLEPVDALDEQGGDWDFVRKDLNRPMLPICLVLRKPEEALPGEGLAALPSAKEEPDERPDDRQHRHGRI